MSHCAKGKQGGHLGRSTSETAMNEVRLRRLVWLAVVGPALLWCSVGRAARGPTLPVLTPEAESGFEHLETLANVHGALGSGSAVDGIAITGNGATIGLRTAAGERANLLLLRPGAGTPVGRYFALAPPKLATATLAELQPRLADALDRAFTSNPWSLPSAQAPPPAPSEGARGPGFWHVGLAMLAALAVVVGLILR